MLSFGTLLKNVLLFAALIIPGYVLGKMKKLNSATTVGMSHILTDIAMPFLVFSKLLEIDVKALSAGELACSILSPFFSVACLLLFALLFFRKREGAPDAAVSRFCSVFSNCGFLGIPLCIALFPNNPEITVYISIYNVFSTFLLLTVGVWILSDGKEKISVSKALISPVSVAVVLGIVISCTGIAPKLGYALTYSTYLAQLTTPLSMIVLGYKLSTLPLQKTVLTPRLYTVSALKLLISPVLCMMAFVLAFVLFDFYNEGLMMAMFIAMAVSTPASAPAMAERYERDGELASILTLGTTVLGVVSVPLMYMLMQGIFWLLSR